MVFSQIGLVLSLFNPHMFRPSVPESGSAVKVDQQAEWLAAGTPSDAEIHETLYNAHIAQATSQISVMPSYVSIAEPPLSEQSNQRAQPVQICEPCDKTHYILHCSQDQVQSWIDKHGLPSLEEDEEPQTWFAYYTASFRKQLLIWLHDLWHYVSIVAVVWLVASVVWWQYNRNVAKKKNDQFREDFKASCEKEIRGELEREFQANKLTYEQDTDRRCRARIAQVEASAKKKADESEQDHRRRIDELGKRHQRKTDELEQSHQQEREASKRRVATSNQDKAQLQKQNWDLWKAKRDLNEERTKSDRQHEEHKELKEKCIKVEANIIELTQERNKSNSKVEELKKELENEKEHSVAHKRTSDYNELQATIAEKAQEEAEKIKEQAEKGKEEAEKDKEEVGKKVKKVEAKLQKVQGEKKALEQTKASLQEDLAKHGTEIDQYRSYIASLETKLKVPKPTSTVNEHNDDQLHHVVKDFLSYCHNGVLPRMKDCVDLRIEFMHLARIVHLAKRDQRKVEVVRKRLQSLRRHRKPSRRPDTKTREQPSPLVNFNQPVDRVHSIVDSGSQFSNPFPTQNVQSASNVANIAPSIAQLPPATHPHIVNASSATTSSQAMPPSPFAQPTITIGSTIPVSTPTASTAAAIPIDPAILGPDSAKEKSEAAKTKAAASTPQTEAGKQASEKGPKLSFFGSKGSLGAEKTSPSRSPATTKAPAASSQPQKATPPPAVLGSSTVFTPNKFPPKKPSPLSAVTGAPPAVPTKPEASKAPVPAAASSKLAPPSSGSGVPRNSGISLPSGIADFVARKTSAPPAAPAKAGPLQPPPTSVSGVPRSKPSALDILAGTGACTPAAARQKTGEEMEVEMGEATPAAGEVNPNPHNLPGLYDGNAMDTNEGS